MTTLLQQQIESEAQLISQKANQFASDVFGDSYKGITDTNLVRSIGLYDKVGQIVQSLLLTTEVKQKRRTITKCPLDLLRTGHTAKAFGESMVDFLTSADTPKKLESKLNTFVFITLSRMFDGSFAIRKDNDKHKSLPDASLLVEVCTSIGQDIEMFSRMEFLKLQDKSLFNQVFYSTLADQVLSQDWHVSKAKEALSGLDVDWTDWSHEQHVRLGRILVGLVLNFYKDNKVAAPFELKLERVDGNKFVYVLPSESLMAQVESDFDSISEKLMVKEFMVCNPVAWQPGVHGGYQTNQEVHRESIVRGHSFVGESKPSDMVYDFINNLQDVAYTVNNSVLDVANTLESMKVSVGKFYPSSAITSRVKKDGGNYTVNPWTIRSTVRTKQALRMANKYGEFDQVFIPWSFDFRGRVYPLVTFAAPQGTDFDKSLIMLANGEELTEEGRWWLYIHIATCFGNGGVDKLPLVDRVEWTHNNVDLIRSISADPIGNLDMWKDASEPWMFLAGCIEFVKVIDNGELTRLMVATDATCSGLQVLSGLSLDRNTAHLVNVVPSDTLQDAYMAVANKAIDILKQDETTAHCAELLSVSSNARKIAKKVVMTVPYNATHRTNFDQVSDAFKELGLTVEKSDAKHVGTAIIEAMGVVVPGAIKLRDWFNDSVVAFFANNPGADSLNWVTPSGFAVHQEKFVIDTITLQATLGGRTEMQVAIGPSKDDDGNYEVRANGHKTSFMPNLIHSLDASLLAMSFHSVDYSVSVIHDSILTGANHMGAAVQALKESYSSIFNGREFLEYLQNDVLQATEPAPVFDVSFESSEVLDSEFFFS